GGSPASSSSWSTSTGRTRRPTCWPTRCWPGRCCARAGCSGSTTTGGGRSRSRSGARPWPSTRSSASCGAASRRSSAATRCGCGRPAEAGLLPAPAGRVQLPLQVVELAVGAPPVLVVELLRDEPDAGPEREGPADRRPPGLDRLPLQLEDPAEGRQVEPPVGPDDPETRLHRHGRPVRPPPDQHDPSLDVTQQVVGTRLAVGLASEVVQPLAGRPRGRRDEPDLVQPEAEQPAE